MCQRCDKEVIEMGILESDLPNLSYSLVKWKCVVDGCRGATKLRDYGIPPLYYWPVKILREKDGAWRGGWVTPEHGYICSRHFKEYKQNSVGFWRKHANTVEYLFSKIIPIIKSKLYKR
jgi:hypothetical protein